MSVCAHWLLSFITYFVEHSAACHEIWVLREQVSMMLFSPSQEKEHQQAQDPPHFQKVIHAVHFPKPQASLGKQLNDAAFAFASKKSQLKSAAELLRAGAKQLGRALSAEARFFAQEAIPLRNQNWRLCLRGSSKDNMISSPVYGGGMFLDYGYDDLISSIEWRHHASADILRLFRDQFISLAANANIISISPSLQLAVGAGGNAMMRLQIRFEPKQPDGLAPKVFQSLQQGKWKRKSVLKPSNEDQSMETIDNGNPAGTNQSKPHLPHVGTSSIDQCIRNVQESYYHQVVFTQLCDQVQHVPNVTLRNKEIVFSLGNSGDLIISLAEITSLKGKHVTFALDHLGTSSDHSCMFPLEELLLRKRMHLSRFCDWLQFRLFTSEVLSILESFAGEIHQCFPIAINTTFVDSYYHEMEGKRYRESTDPFPAARMNLLLSDDMDPDGLLITMHLECTGQFVQIALQPPTVMTVRVPSSGRHVLVADPRQIVQLLQYQVGQEIAEHLTKKFTSIRSQISFEVTRGCDPLGVLEMKPALPEILLCPKFKVEVNWLPMLTIVVNQTSASQFSEGWEERLLSQAGLL
jgi:hypothetical protein